jgi:RNA polymerase sigma factor (sigma-70 family)
MPRVEAKMIQPQAGGARWIVSALSLYEGPLLRYASRLLGDVDRARDVVQDTFLRLCREDPARLDGHLAQWLFTVCRNRALDVQRKEGRVQPLDERQLEEQPATAPGPARLLEQREDLQAVLGVVATLPASQQEVLRLKFQGGLTYQEIAGVTGLSVSHVGVLLHNAIKAIRVRVR